jgi:hypothetical protein
MTSLDLVAIGAPIAALIFMGLVALVETRLMARAKRREQLAASGREKLSEGTSAASAAHPDSVAAAKTQTAAE